MSLFGSSKVKYVRTEKKVVPQDPSSYWTYEIHKADSREDAVTFLKSKSVTKGLYYIIVEYPGGSMGKDIDGIFQES